MTATNLQVDDQLYHQRMELVERAIQEEGGGEWKAERRDYGWDLWHESGGACRIHLDSPVPAVVIVMRAERGLEFAVGRGIPEELLGEAARFVLRRGEKAPRVFERWVLEQTRTKNAVQAM